MNHVQPNKRDLKVWHWYILYISTTKWTCGYHQPTNTTTVNTPTTPRSHPRTITVYTTTIVLSPHHHQLPSMVITTQPHITLTPTPPNTHTYPIISSHYHPYPIHIWMSIITSYMIHTTSPFYEWYIPIYESPKTPGLVTIYNINCRKLFHTHTVCTYMTYTCITVSVSHQNSLTPLKILTLSPRIVQTRSKLHICKSKCNPPGL